MPQFSEREGPMGDTQNRFVWIDLATTDLGAAAEFYQHVIGWEITGSKSTDCEYLAVSVGPVMVGGLLPSAAEPTPSDFPLGWLGYIRVANVDRAVEKIVGAGGRIELTPTDIPDVGRFAIAVDPQGARFKVFASDHIPVPQQPRAGEFGRVAWHELHTADAPMAMRFYADLFRWSGRRARELRGVCYRALPTEATSGAVLSRGDWAAAPFWLHFISVEDLQTSTARVCERGGKLIGDPYGLEGVGTAMQCIDPQGIRFGLIQLSRN